MFLKKSFIGKKTLSVMLVCAMVSAVGVTSAITTTATVNDKQTADATTVQTESSANAYGLKDNIQDGVILHAWEWSLSNIKEKLPQIAQAGYTAVQTTVLQHCKESTAGKANDGWWVYYQPASFALETQSGYSALGTKADLEALCTEADKYGIKVIVDVVANHLGNKSGYDLSPSIPDDIRNDSNCWHSDGFTEINYGNRYSITHGSMNGLPDLNTENTKIQTYVKNYLRECIDTGVDGFRFDAAKHISVPDEGGEYTFWSNVIPDATSYAQTKGVSLYCYGEVLNQTTEGGGPAITGYTKYMSVTENTVGNSIRTSMKNKNVQGVADGSYHKGTSPDKAVLWAESHDTYANQSENEYERSNDVSDFDINKTWGMVGARNKATALYFARTNGFTTKIGTVNSTQCFSDEVVAVNKFHNYYAGQNEYVAYSGSVAYVERGTDGVVLVNVGGSSQQVSVPAHIMKDGTYKDQITGNTFTVSGGQISGQIGSTGVAVVYNATEPPTQPTQPTQPTTKPTEKPTTAGESYMIGDANGDKAVNMKDCVLMQKVVVGSTTLTGTSLKSADVTGDSKVSVGDIVAVMRYLVGYTNTYNIGTLVGVENPTSPTTPTTPTSPTNPVPSNTVSLDPSAIATGTERWVLYVWKSDTDNKWINMSGSGSSFKADIPDGYTNFIVVRMNGGTTENNWDNKWNQTSDLSTANGTVIKATGWGANGTFTVTQSN